MTGNNNTELHNAEVAQLQARLAAQQSGSVVLQNAINDLNT